MKGEFLVGIQRKVILIRRDIGKQRNKEVMRRRVKIKSERETNAIIQNLKGLVKKGQRPTKVEKEDYEFANIFLTDIKKRKKK